VPFNDHGRWGYSDLKGNIKIQPQFGGAGFFSFLQYAEIHSTDRNYTGIIDTLGNIILPCQYKTIDYTPYFIKALDTTHNQFGLYTTKGQILLKHEYEEMQLMRQYITAKKGKNQFVFKVNHDQNIEKILSVSDAHVYLEYNWSEDNLEHIKVIKGEKTYYYSENGKLISKENTFGDDIQQSDLYNGYAEDGWDNNGLRESSWDIYRGPSGLYGITYYYMGREKPDSFPAEYDLLEKGFLPYPYYAENSFYFARKSGNFGIVNVYNEELIPFDFDSINLDPGPYAAASSSLENGINFYVKKDGLWGVVNTHSKYDYLLRCVYSSIDTRHLPWVMLEKDNSFGLAHLSGENIVGIIEPKYPRIHEVQYNFKENTLLLVENKEGDKFWVNLNGFEYFIK
jgi:WG containing repeat